jgi:hypothetical protein
MVDKEQICLLHWIPSLDRHTKQLIKFELLNQHKPLIRKVTSLGEANNLYPLICYWWFSSRVAFEVHVHKLGNWFSSWHSHVRQWGGFMVHVNISSTNFLWVPFSSLHWKLEFLLHYLHLCYDISNFTEFFFPLISSSSMMRSGQTCPLAM